jgi:hypothetical protein
MKLILIGLLSAGLTACTTGSKYRYIENHYTNTECSPYGSAYSHPHHVEIQPLIDYDRDLNSCDTYYILQEARPVYHYDSRRATMAGLGKAMGEKMLRKMRAAYNEQ